MTVEITLNGLAMGRREAAHAHLKQQFAFPESYGCNLDALYDLLTAVCTPTQVCLREKDAMLRSLGSYGEGILQCLLDASESNPNLQLHIF